MTSSYAVCSEPAAAAALCGDPQLLRGPHVTVWGGGHSPDWGQILPCWVSALHPPLLSSVLRLETEKQKGNGTTGGA